MCHKRQCNLEVISQQILFHDDFFVLYVEDTVRLRIWYCPYLLFFSLFATLIILTACILSHPEHFAYSLFDEWDNYDGLFERADRVLQGSTRKQLQSSARTEDDRVVETRGQYQVDELLAEKPRHLPQLHRQWLKDAHDRFGAKLHSLLAEYEECGTNIQRVCLSETATNLRDVMPHQSELSDELDSSRASEVD